MVIKNCLYFIILLTYLSLIGCATTNVSYLDLNISSSKYQNPDINGRPSPLILKVIEVKNQEVFSGLPYFDLNENVSQSLGIDYISHEELVLLPGEDKQLKYKVRNSTKFIAFIGEFRDIENSEWRYVFPVKEGKQSLNLLVTDLEILRNVGVK